MEINIGTPLHCLLHYSSCLGFDDWATNVVFLISEVNFSDPLNQKLDDAPSSFAVSVSQTDGVSQSEIQKRISRTLYKVEPNENLKYKCEECESEYSKRASLIKHRLHIHDGFSYDCELCGEKFSRNSKLKAHKDVVHQGLSFDCDLCGKVFETCKRLLSHKTRSKETCKLCNFVACNHHIFVKHLTTHDPLYQNNAFSCEVCGYRARKRVILKTHIKVVHEKFRLSCDLCEFKSKDKSAIREHKMAVHEGIKLKCSECDYECNMKKQMSKHTNTLSWLVWSPLSVEMAAPLLRRGAATTSASKNRLLPGLRGLLIPPDRGRSPLFRVCPAGSWEQLWFLVVHILDSHLRRYYCTTSTCDGRCHISRRHRLIWVYLPTGAVRSHSARAEFNFTVPPPGGASGARQQARSTPPGGGARN